MRERERKSEKASRQVQDLNHSRPHGSPALLTTMPPAGPCVQNSERRMEEKGLQCDHPPWGVISRFLFLCLSGERTGPIAKTSQKNPPKTKDFIYSFGRHQLSIYSTIIFITWLLLLRSEINESSEVIEL